jgi:hypothetical protein
MFIFARSIKISKCAIRAEYSADAKCELQSVARLENAPSEAPQLLYLLGLLTVRFLRNFRDAIAQINITSHEEKRNEFQQIVITRMLTAYYASPDH